jgi:hypothetical protein
VVLPKLLASGRNPTANLAVEGPTDKLVAAGSLALKHKLAGFDSAVQAQDHRHHRRDQGRRDTDFRI